MPSAHGMSRHEVSPRHTPSLRSLVVCAVLVLADVCVVTGGDVETVGQRLVEWVANSAAGDCSSLASCNATSHASLAAALRDAAALNPDGSWPDVNYSDRTRTGEWSPHLHLDRIVNMAAVVALAANNMSNTSTTLVPPTLRAVDHWLAVDPQSDNWWWNELRVPDRIADTTLLLGPTWLRKGPTRDGMIKVMARAEGTGRTGANLDDEVATVVKRGVVQSNSTAVASGFTRVWSEVYVSQPSGCIDPPPGTTGCPTDGIQADRSFHQHGPELLAGTYGEDYAADTLLFVWLAADTAFAMPPERVSLFSSLLLDGMRWMTVGAPSVWDWSVRGRDIGGTPRRVHLNSSMMTMLGPDRADELGAFGAEIDGGSAEPLIGHRAFWNSDYSVVRSVGSDGGLWMASVRMHSNRTVSARCVNGQGAMNEHTGDGLVYTYRDGEEYKFAFYSWDWRRLPGITADVDAPMLPCNYSERLRVDSEKMNATGTVSDGIAGLSALHLVSANATAHKTVAMLPHALVHLVAGAQCRAGAVCGRIVTTIENKDARGSVYVACSGTIVQQVALGTLRETRTNCSWVWHDSIGYLLPADTEVMLTNGAEPSIPGAHALFSIAIAHTLRSLSTSVVAVAGVTLDEMAGVAAAGANVTVLANTDAGQAVWDASSLRLVAVVWSASQPVALAPHPPAPPPGVQVSAIQANRPCAVLIEQSSECGSFNVTASDLSNDPNGENLTVQLTGDVGASVCSVPPCACVTEGDITTVTLPLPTGFNAGQSVTVTCIPH